MQPQMADLLARAEAQTSKVEAQIAPLTNDAFLTRPQPDKWSVAEHLQHLVLTNQAYILTVDQAVARARAQGLEGEGPFGGGRFVNGFIRRLAPPVTRRFKTFKSVTPPPELDRVTVTRGFMETQAALVDALVQADGVDLNRVKIRSPLLRLLKMNAFQALSLLVVHNDRHLWHLDQILG